MVNYIMEILALIASVCLFFALFVRHRYGYWQRRNVPYLKPIFPLGNNSTILPRGITIGLIGKRFYDEFKKMGCNIGGVFLGLDPKLVILDPDIAKEILTTDFAYFVDRGIYKTKSDPTTVHLFSQEGGEWKTARSKSTALFTSAKMRNFLKTIEKTSQEMVASLEKNAREKSDVDILEVLACYTTDVIGSTVLGLECNSFKDPNAEFRKMGRHVFNEFRCIDQVRLFFTIYFPKFAETVGISNIQPEVAELYIKLVRDIVKYRKKHSIKRNDFLQLLIDMPNATMDNILGQTFLFFTAGFETSSTTATLTLFELAQNPEVQNRLRNEIEECMKENNNQITYDTLMGMEYLNAVVEETLRKWPPVTTLTRVCVKDYTFRDTNITVEKNTGLIIPVFEFHRDPEYFPNPTKWDPERFMGENVKHTVYFPFGEGPRMCTGMRFGLMQTKLGLLAILRNYQIHSSPKTITPLELDPDTFVLHTKQKIYLRLTKL